MICLVVIASLVAIACAAAMLIAAASRRHKQGARGEVNLIGRVGTIEKDLRPEGAVLVAGEQWPARSRSGDVLTRAGCPRVRVTGVAGYRLEVEPEE
jgi:membrane-bound ClpP family serine protease